MIQFSRTGLGLVLEVSIDGISIPSIVLSSDASIFVSTGQVVRIQINYGLAFTLSASCRNNICVDECPSLQCVHGTIDKVNCSCICENSWNGQFCERPCK